MHKNTHIVHLLLPAKPGNLQILGIRELIETVESKIKEGLLRTF